MRAVSPIPLPSEPDELPGFTKRPLELPREADGPLRATLVSATVGVGRKRAVLFVHGYADYFFHVHVAQAVLDAGLGFAALDLRRSGRSRDPKNWAHFARSIDDYFVELDWAIDALAAEGTTEIVLFAHSTGGLIGVHYAARGARRAALVGLVLNSPFFSFSPQGRERFELAVASAIGRILPGLSVRPGLDTGYGRTLHASQLGTFDYDLEKKPLEAFPIRAGWVRMILLAQVALERSLGVTQPVLVLHSSASRRAGPELVPADFTSDLVLGVEEMKLLAPQVGPRVTLREIQDGKHDLTLSSPEPQREAIAALVEFACS